MSKSMEKAIGLMFMRGIEKAEQEKLKKKKIRDSKTLCVGSYSRSHDGSGPGAPQGPVKNQRIPGGPRGRHCGRRVATFVMQVCGQICEPNFAYELATQCCSQKCDADTVKKVCCFSYTPTPPSGLRSPMYL
ncbi:hypothetical protein GCK72_022436 [Caenorhabditis remanei]|uniref:Uncharacterized protein n=1 Tax=Caenorhabditis remanei TaxID=31234 RepID=A0A6A5FU04_CAERE|nr:hypothetical protein GCK72_022436 [Caenorhabditis remanei]KAF1745986.1 hypothetical protein GCK72_022436 [Caenorhabditis remanei]